MFSEKMEALGSKRSVIREIFEYAKVRASQIGRENIFDFSIGNPSVPAPACVNETIADLIAHTDSVQLHGYTSAQGDAGVRKIISDSIHERFGASMKPELIYMTAGAAAALTISFKALLQAEDEIILFAPFFPEYRVFVESMGGKPVTVAAEKDTLQIDLNGLRAALSPHTKAIVLNSPNNPSGVVLTEDCIKAVAALLSEKQEEYGHQIYIITDEPYRELVYDDIKVPYVMNYYDNTLVCYSYSKALSLPGERIGYIAVSPRAKDASKLYAAVCGAGRALGYVCAPSLFQQVIARCNGATADVSVYKRNRDLLYSSLTEYGFRCVRPDGAFYLFMQSPTEDSSVFCEKAKEYELLLVPGEDFGTAGYVRIAYCVQTELIERALPAFQKLAEAYHLR